MAIIYFAGGCFWGTEHFFKKVYGVTDTEAGYANSVVENPSYRDVCSGETGAAETVRVEYDPALISLDKLVDLYFMTIDPTAVNRQGNDVGTQYRTGIYYTSPAQLAELEPLVAREAARHPGTFAVELAPLRNFYPAETYHQDYLDKNPRGYCHLPSRLFRLAAEANRPTTRYEKPSQQELRERLTPLQYSVTQQNGTEPPFRNEYWQEHRKGVYVDVTTGEPLFVSSDKFDSGCGWPAFSRPINPDALKYVRDTSHGMNRVEVRSALGDAHLGHVFEDGPADRGGLRYCINSASLRFIPLESLPPELDHLRPLIK